MSTEVHVGNMITIPVRGKMLYCFAYELCVVLDTGKRWRKTAYYKAQVGFLL